MKDGVSDSDKHNTFMQFQDEETLQGARHSTDRLMLCFLSIVQLRIGRARFKIRLKSRTNDSKNSQLDEALMPVITVLYELRCLCQIKHIRFISHLNQADNGFTLGLIIAIHWAISCCRDMFSVQQEFYTRYDWLSDLSGGCSTSLAVNESSDRNKAHYKSSMVPPKPSNTSL